MADTKLGGSLLSRYTPNTEETPTTGSILARYTPEKAPSPTANQSKLGALGSAFVQGAGGLAADVYIGASDIATNIHNIFTDDEGDWDPREMPLASGARHFKKQLEEEYFPVDPKHEGVGTDIARGLGQFGPQVLAGGAGLAAGAGRVGAALIGSGIGSTQRISQIGEEYDRAVAEGKTKYDPVDRFSAQLMGAGTTLATETPVVLGALKRLNNSTGGLIGDTLKGFAGEGLQEMTEKVVDDLVAKNIVKYDPDRKQFFETAEAAKELGYEGFVGGSVGAIVNFMTSAMGIRHRGKIEKAAQEALQKDLQTARDLSNPNQNINPVTKQEFTDSGLQKQWRSLAPSLNRIDDMRLQGYADIYPERFKRANEYVASKMKNIVSSFYLKEGVSEATRQEVEGLVYDALGDKGVNDIRETRAKALKAKEDEINLKREKSKKAAEAKKAKEAEKEKARQKAQKDKPAAERDTKPVEPTKKEEASAVPPVTVVTPQGTTELERTDTGEVVTPFTATHEKDGKVLQATTEEDKFVDEDGTVVIEPSAVPVIELPTATSESFVYPKEDATVADIQKAIKKAKKIEPETPQQLQEKTKTLNTLSEMLVQAKKLRDEKPIVKEETVEEDTNTKVTSLIEEASDYLEDYSPQKAKFEKARLIQLSSKALEGDTKALAELEKTVLKIANESVNLQSEVYGKQNKKEFTDIELQDRINNLKTLDEANELVHQLGYVTGNSEGSLKEQLVSAWENASDMLLEEKTISSEKEAVDIIKNSINLSKEDNERIAAIKAATQKVQPAPVEPTVERVPSDIIVKKDGNPYSSEKIAKVQLKKQGLTDTHKVIPVGNGFALTKLSEEEKAVKTEEPIVTKPIPKAAPVEEAPEKDYLVPENGNISLENVAVLDTRWNTMVKGLQNSGRIPDKVKKLSEAWMAIKGSGMDFNDPQAKAVYAAMVRNLTGGTVDPFKAPKTTKTITDREVTPEIIQEAYDTDKALLDSVEKYIGGKGEKPAQPSTLYRGVPTGTENRDPASVQYEHTSPWKVVAQSGGQIGGAQDVQIASYPTSPDQKYYRGGSLAGDPLERTRIDSSKGLTWDEALKKAISLSKQIFAKSKKSEKLYLDSLSPEERFRYLKQLEQNAIKDAAQDFRNATFETDALNRPGKWTDKEVPNELKKEQPVLRKNTADIEKTNRIEAGDRLLHGTKNLELTVPTIQDNTALPRALGVHVTKNEDTASVFATDYTTKNKVGKVIQLDVIETLRLKQVPQTQKEKSDDHAVMADIVNTVFPENKQLFIEWFPGNKDIAEKVYSSLEQNKAATTNTFGQYGVDNATTFGEYVTAIGDYSIKNKETRSKILDAYNNYLKKNGYDGVSYINTSGIEGRGETSYIITNIDKLAPASRTTNQAGDVIAKDELPPFNPDALRRQAGDNTLTEEETLAQEERVRLASEELQKRAPITEETEIVPAEDVAVRVEQDEAVSDLKSLEDRIADQKDLIADMEDNPLTDPEDIKAEKRLLQGLLKERRNLVGKAETLKPKQGYSDKELEAEVNEIKEFDSTLDETAEDFSESLYNEAQLRQRSSQIRNQRLWGFDQQKAVVDRFKYSLSPSVNRNLEIIFARGPEDIPDTGARERYSQGKDLPQGFYMRGNTRHGLAFKKKDLVVIFYKDYYTLAELERVIFHEVVGHFGFRNLFKQNWDVFVNQMMENHSFLRLAYDNRKTWTQYNTTPGKGPTITFKDNNGNVVVADKYAMFQLMDEVIAQTAESWSDPMFRRDHPKSSGLMNRFAAWIKHLLRKSGFGRYIAPITRNELFSLVSESHIMLTDPSQAVSKKTKRLALKQVDAISKNEQRRNVVNKQRDGTEQISFQQALVKNMIEEVRNDPANDQIETQEAIDIQLSPARTVAESRKTAVATGEDLTYIQKVSKLHETDIGKVGYNKWQQFVTKLDDKIRKSKHFEFFRTLGTMSMPKMWAKIEGDLKGTIGNAQRKGRIYNHLIRKENLNEEQHVALYEYFTTKDADHTRLPVSTKLQELAKELKDDIARMGQILAKSGRLPEDIEEANRGSYLPLRYWKYISQYLGAGKKLSFQNYLKGRDPDLTTEDKAQLGVIRDTSILVPETISVMARDIALHDFFNTVRDFDKQNGYGWFLGKEAYAMIDGRRMNSEALRNEIQHLHSVIALGQKDPLFATEEEVESNKERLKRYEEAFNSVKDQVKTELTNLLKARGEEVTPEKLQQVLTSEYKFITEPSFGSLQYKWVHKAIYDDLVESFDDFSTERNDIMAKAFGPGGKVEKLHQMWKANKVILNPPSWIRNLVGNFVLLDIGTRTNMASLSKMLFEEVKAHLVDNNPSDYMKLARDKGLWDNTYSMTELYLLQQSTVDKLKVHLKTAEADGFAKSSVWRMWYSGLGTFHNALEYANNVYGGLEGVFKTVAMRDHIQKWLKENGYKSLDEVQDPAVREVVIDEAVYQANKVIFDYSKVPAWLRTTRKMPFVGAPFLTFTYKAIPATIDAMARRPHKVIKYMMLPYLLSQVAMAAFDWDDKDLAEIQRKMPMWMQEQSSVFILPWKDSNGKLQGVPFGYYLPWSPAIDWGLMAYRNYDSSNKILSSMGTAKDILFDMGFLGGPAPTVMTALLSNKDPFTKQEIYKEGATSYENYGNLSRFMYTMWMPTFMTSYGVLGRLIDQTGIEIPPFSTGQSLNRYGTDKETMGQTLARGVGLNIYGFDPNESNRSNLKYFESERRKIITARSHSLKDPNLTVEQKASRVREYTEKIKLLNEKQRKFMTGQ